MQRLTVASRSRPEARPVGNLAIRYFVGQRVLRAAHRVLVFGDYNYSVFPF
jgi:hypothetical protein